MYDSLQGFLHYFVQQNRETTKNPQKESNAVKNFFPTKYWNVKYVWGGEEDGCVNSWIYWTYPMVYATANLQ
jgi:hypothetical protein